MGLAVLFSLGAWRISKSNVLTRRNSAIESLGACTVLCTDKTGTLWDHASGHRYVFRDPSDAEERVDEECHEVVEYAILSSQRDPFDPMEMALWRLAEQEQVDSSHTHAWEMIKEYPLTRELLATSRVYRLDEAEGIPNSSSSGATAFVVAVKGAYEAVADLCHMSAEETAAGQRVAQEFAEMGSPRAGRRQVRAHTPSETAARTRSPRSSTTTSSRSSASSRSRTPSARPSPPPSSRRTRRAPSPSASASSRATA